MIEQGRVDAIAAIEKGETSLIDNHLHLYMMKKQGDKRINGMSFEQFIEAKKEGVIESKPEYLQFLQWKHNSNIKLMLKISKNKLTYINK